MSDPDKAHSRIVGGSSAERVLQCNGSIRLVSETIAKSSSYADEGTALHLAMEWLLRENEGPENAVGRTFHGQRITSGQVDGCLVPATKAFERIVGDREFQLEVALPFPGVDGAFGTADVVYWDDDGALAGIIDWKFGSGHKVEPEGNAQMMFYLYSQAMHAGTVTDPLRATIVQPRLGHVATASFTMHDLIRFAFQLSASVEAPETFHKGNWCHWCPGKPRCPEHWGKTADWMQEFIISVDPRKGKA